MSTLAKHISTRTTPQTEPIPGKPMIPNSTGGYSFAVDDWTRLDRWLCMGSDKGTYYATERKLTQANAACVQRCLAADPVRAVARIADVSFAGRAPKNDYAILALAIAAADPVPATRKLALEALPRVCRIGTHVLQFAAAVNELRGWGAGLRKAIANWFASKPADALAYQVAKYARRDGWALRDLLRLAHVQAAVDTPHNAIYRWVVGGAAALPGRAVRTGKAQDAPTRADPDVAALLPPFLAAVDQARTADTPTLLGLIRAHNLPRECVPTERLNDPDVWEALLEKMPLTALVRNLGKLTAVGLLKPLAQAERTIADRLVNQEYIRASRLHPIAILLAARQYAVGHGDKGKLTWTPSPRINDALDAAFLKAFATVEPTNKRTLIGVDVSGSMTSAIAGGPISAREAAAALALVTAKTEPNYALMAFQDRFMPLDFSACTNLVDAVRKTSGLPFGRTDCSLPMVWALQNKLAVDTFLVFTDSETYAGVPHPCQALQNYRRETGIPAKLIVAAFAANEFTIADPSDGGMLDVIGLDASVPTVMADFARG
jgi:60 kDa SS-A/Ro ribonucleoprotein